jgi:hypothetical protein
MARIEEREQQPQAENDDADVGMDDWFSRRLESQGIPVRLGRPPTARIVAVVGLGAALLALIWALSSVGSHGSTSTPTTPTAPVTTGAGGGNGNGGGGNGGSTTPAKVSWSDVTVDILNGVGTSGIAATTAQGLAAEGWTIGRTGNASGVTETEVVYLPGHKAQAKAVAKKLKLAAPVPIAEATGVPADETDGVAIVLGPNLLASAG